MSELKDKPLIIRAIAGEKTNRAPVWLMRQAGRYMPEYQEIRKRYDFKTMFKTPELAVEISLQPVKKFAVDGAIIFSDITVLPEALGLGLEFIEGKGPVFSNPVRTAKDVEKITSREIDGNLDYVGKIIRTLKREIDKQVALIGFSGAPWTLTKYIVDGSNLKSHRFIKYMRFSQPELLKRLLDFVADKVIEHCKSQVEAGADLIQLFDSSASIIDDEGFSEFVLPYAKKTIDALRSEGVPVIYFSRDTGYWLNEISELGADILSVDWTVNPRKTVELCRDKCGLQGNLDPGVLYCDPETIRGEVKKMLNAFKESPKYIANLGHGVKPDTPNENVACFVEAVKKESEKLYSNV